jgi:hypothetical protein
LVIHAVIEHHLAAELWPLSTVLKAQMFHGVSGSGSIKGMFLCQNSLHFLNGGTGHDSLFCSTPEYKEAIQ